MSASLVGSEMCIRDSTCTARRTELNNGAQNLKGDSGLYDEFVIGESRGFRAAEGACAQGLDASWVRRGGSA
eukprot:14683962-Alexandrium_andersonii.AAC.1